MTETPHPAVVNAVISRCHLFPCHSPVGYWSWVECHQSLSPAGFHRRSGTCASTGLHPCSHVDVSHARDTCHNLYVPHFYQHRCRCLPLVLRIIAPFLVLILLNVPQIQPSNLFVPSLTPDLNQLVGVLYWGYSGFDAMGAYASDIASPQETYPRASMLTVTLMVFTYTVPFLAASGAKLYIIVDNITGTALRTWFLGCTVSGNLGIYIAKMIKNGFLCCHGWPLPRNQVFHSFRTLLTHIIQWCPSSCHSLCLRHHYHDGVNVILSVNNLLSALACLTELAAVVHLSFTRSYLQSESLGSLHRSYLGSFYSPLAPSSCGRSP
ncbi:hypothetical protein PsorP6_004888 [Peronosclerospora sorghi]|uniref:Uncharacterized protein n=1 Tax=Peronosclerospora sorghi TaxID=230839 RepID=A0ACC0W645_9STRA|nr:hypothetical protein PsorP6_004888 [Peronosclerospora sorghi]